VGVIGDPVDHSLSPVLHNSALVEMGLDWVYVAFPVPAGRGREAVAAMADLGIRGLSVTMPHKVGAALACHRLAPAAQRLGVANTVTLVGGELVGDSTDGPGFVDALADQGWHPEGKRCLVLGAGGAARAVVVALADAGAAAVGVAARHPERAATAAALAGPVGSVAGVEAAAGADLVVNATPVGMAGVAVTGGQEPSAGGTLPLGLDPGRLGPGQLVADLIYAPATTELLAVARARGAETCNGLGMLIHQAARQVTLWTGRPPSVGAMSAAALRELGRRADQAGAGHVAYQVGPGTAP
jgi:shikimate dehydrogenase